MFNASRIMSKLIKQPLYKTNLFCKSNIGKVFRRGFSEISTMNSSQMQSEREKIQFNKKYSALFNLKNRTIVSVSGQDSTNFLQSMITNDMKIFDKEFDRAAIFGLFLNPKGRVLYDAIIIKSQFSEDEFPEYWLDIETSEKEEFMQHLLSHIIRKKVKIEDMSDFLEVNSYISLIVGDGPNYLKEGKIWQELQATAEYQESETNQRKFVTDSITFFDPRLCALGARIVCPKETLDIDAEFINKKDKHDDYEAMRMLYCVPEGHKELKDKLPLNNNLHLLNGINFKKGCYIGQELTQRTYHTGVIRKVLMPFICTEKLIFSISDDTIEGDILIPFQSIKRDFKVDFTGEQIIDGNGIVIGKVINSKWNCGIAMIDKDLLVNSANPTFKIGENKITIYDPISLWESISNIVEENNKKSLETKEEDIDKAAQYNNPDNN